MSAGGLDRKSARAEVARRLSEGGDPLVIVAELLQSPEPMVRACAISALEGRDDERLPPLLLRAAQHDPSVDVRHVALLALEDHVSGDALPCLLASVRDGAPRPLRITAAKQLGSYDTEASLRALVDLVDDEDAYVAEGAIESLARLKRPEAHALYRAIARSWAGTMWAELAEGVLNELGAPGPNAEDLARDKRDRAGEKLASPDARDRLSGLRTLRMLSPEDLMERVTPLLRDTEPRVRAAAVITLGEAGDPRATPLLLEAALDPSNDVKAAALRALGRRRDPAIATRLIAWSRDPSFGDPIVRTAIALDLGDYEDAAAVEALRAMTEDERPLVRNTALDVLEGRRQSSKD